MNQQVCARSQPLWPLCLRQKRTAHRARPRRSPLPQFRRLTRAARRAPRAGPCWWGRLRSTCVGWRFAAERGGGRGRVAEAAPVAVVCQHDPRAGLRRGRGSGRGRGTAAAAAAAAGAGSLARACRLCKVACARVGGLEAGRGLACASALLRCSVGSAEAGEETWAGLGRRSERGQAGVIVGRGRTSRTDRSASDKENYEEPEELQAFVDVGVLRSGAMHISATWNTDGFSATRFQDRVARGGTFW